MVIDSVTFHFRHDFTDMGRRTRLLGDMGQRLMQLAAVRDVAVRILICVLSFVPDCRGMWPCAHGLVPHHAILPAGLASRHPRIGTTVSAEPRVHLHRVQLASQGLHAAEWLV